MFDEQIVVGVDGSEPAGAAMAWAAAAAAATGAALTIVVVADPRAPLTASPDSVVNAAIEHVGAAARDRVVVRRRAGDVALELAEEAGAGLLVIGTHKTGFLRGRVLGSRSLRIAAAARGPVAIVPAGPLDARVGVVVGLESHLDPRSAVLAGAAHARRMTDDLVIVQSLDGSPADLVADDGTITVDAARVRVSAAAHLAAAQLAVGPAAGVTVRTRVSARAPAEAFLDASQAARLLVVGASTDDRRVAFAGSTVHDVVLNANAPLLVVPTTMLG
jgi:nucleotide-binding universal stress UspA family protein